MGVMLPWRWIAPSSLWGYLHLMFWLHWQILIFFLGEIISAHFNSCWCWSFLCTTLRNCLVGKYKGQHCSCLNYSCPTDFSLSWHYFFWLKIVNINWLRSRKRPPEFGLFANNPLNILKFKFHIFKVLFFNIRQHYFFTLKCIFP